MNDADILAQFDGRGRAEFLLGGFESSDANKITAFGFEFGYDLHSTEIPSKSSMRLIYLRNDSPTARQRAWQTQARLAAGGPLLSMWMAPGAEPGTVRPISAFEIARKRRGIETYESNGVRGLAVFIGLLSLGCFVLVGVLRDRSIAGLAVLGILGVALAVAAVLVPRWLRRWYERDRRLVDLYDRQRSGHVGPPPPPPPAPPHPGAADRYRPEGYE
ncbi:hypothetical protein [Streptomyces sp. NPDC057381]|uniref:hypothetical protein n=1 Tax=Streptomyces sp. NPDC057381 TaxID=3346111 RepID=UPI00363AC6F8